MVVVEMFMKCLWKSLQASEKRKRDAEAAKTGQQDGDKKNGDNPTDNSKDDNSKDDKNGKDHKSDDVDASDDKGSDKNNDEKKEGSGEKDVDRSDEKDATGDQKERKENKVVLKPREKPLFDSFDHVAWMSNVRYFCIKNYTHDIP